ncbi:MAG: hypothetical protein DRQ56_06760 [Gammaproteobacteria bacterium]|nr:MAG: hypothetical protein DRQ56_06760 [Gammaproteobacteria bacterium]
MKKKQPEHLSKEAGEWWQKLVAEYDINDDGGRLLLMSAMESFDRLRSCQEAIARDGELVKDRFEQLKPHPLLPAETAARAQMLAALKALNLDVEPLRDRPGNPGRGNAAHAH